MLFLTNSSSPVIPFMGNRYFQWCSAFYLLSKKTHEKTKANNVNIYFQFLKTDLKKKSSSLKQLGSVVFSKYFNRI